MSKMLFQTIMPMLPTLNSAACENVLKLTANEINKKRKDLKINAKKEGIEFEWKKEELEETNCTKKEIPFVQMAQVRGPLNGVIPIPGKIEFVEMNNGGNIMPAFGPMGSIPISPYGPFGPTVGIPYPPIPSSSSSTSPPDKDKMLKYLEEYTELKKLIELYEKATDESTTPSHPAPSPPAAPSTPPPSSPAAPPPAPSSDKILSKDDIFKIINNLDFIKDVNKSIK